MAHRAYHQVAGAPAGLAGLGAFMAGALAPDMGFFPGGPLRFSSRAHGERTGDFLRALEAEVAGELERCFVAGWALHLWTDLAIHPLVDRWLSDAGAAPRRSPVWELRHKRLEWGLDCLLLEQPDLSFLWAAPLSFPRRGHGPALLGVVGPRFYGADAEDARIWRGARSLCRWIGRLPRILLWSGQVRAAGRRGPAVLGPCLRPVTELIGRALAPFPRWQDAAAVARPTRLPGDQARLARQEAEEVLCRFAASLAERFAGFPNVDLDGGRPA